MNRKEIGHEVSRRELLTRAATLILPDHPPFLIPPALNCSIYLYHEINGPQYYRDLLTLFDNCYQPISVETLVGYFNGVRKISNGLKTFMITWDDGLLSQYRKGLQVISDIQAKTGVYVPVTAFMMTKFNDPGVSIDQLPDDTPTYNDRVHAYVNKGQVLEMIESGIQVNNHTVNHSLNFASLPADVLISEIITGEQRIEALYKLAGRQRQVRALAYPKGEYNDFILSTVQSLGYDCAYSTEPTANHPYSTRFHLGRIQMSA